MRGRDPVREGRRTVADAFGAVNPASLGVDSTFVAGHGRVRPSRTRPAPSESSLTVAVLFGIHGALPFRTMLEGCAPAYVHVGQHDVRTD
jgi:hypothetical protein